MRSPNLSFSLNFPLANGREGIGKTIVGCILCRRAVVDALAPRRWWGVGASQLAGLSFLGCSPAFFGVLKSSNGLPQGSAGSVILKATTHGKTSLVGLNVAQLLKPRHHVSFGGATC